MKIKIRQNWRSKYNLLSDDESLSFIMDIVDDKNNTITVDGIKARLQLNSDIESYESPEDQICEIYNDCWKYATSVWSSTNYKAQCLLFAKLFNENYKELCETRILEQTEWISKEIERLQNKAKNLYGYDDISYEVSFGCNKEIEMYSKWIENNNKELEQLKENSEKAIQLINKNKEYQDKIEYFTNSKIEECYYE